MWKKEWLDEMEATNGFTGFTSAYRHLQRKFGGDDLPASRKFTSKTREIYPDSFPT